jgi:hypothetical protein
VKDAGAEKCIPAARALLAEDPLADINRDMDPRTALSVAIPAVALLIVVASPDKPRWVRRPSFIRREPSRFQAALLFFVFLGIAVLHAIA